MDVLREAWRGALPLRVTLAESDVTTLNAPAPFFIMAPLHGYLPLLADYLKPHFQSVLPPGEDTVWFDYQGLPLKWHIPTGVLYDLFAPKNHSGPWHLTVHFRAFPHDLLVPIEDPQTMRWHFFNCLKEAVYALYGSTKYVMTLSQADQAELWKAIAAGDGAAYERASARLRPNLPEEVEGEGKGEQAGGSRNTKGPIPTLRDVLHKNVPHLFPTLPSPPPVAPPPSSSSTLVTSLSSVSITDSGGGSGNMGASVLRETSEEAVEGEGGSSEGGGETEPSVGETGGGETKQVGEGGDGGEAGLGEGGGEARESSQGEGSESGSSEKCKKTASEVVDAVEREGGGGVGGDMEGERQPSFALEREEGMMVGRVSVQGVPLSLDTPIEWIACNLCAPDLFVHVVVVAPRM